MSSLEEKVINAYEEVKESVVTVSTIKLIDFIFTIRPIKGIGSGVIIDNNGYIVTNAHVISEYERIYVGLYGGERFEGKVIGIDRRSDIALLKVQGKGFKSAKLGDSSKLKVGQFVIAVGNPLTHIIGGPTMTFGVISGLRRTIRTKEKVFENLIQTDAAINPGNSGGPLVNLNGEVVGITTAMIPFAQGIGFAIPIDEVKEVTEQLVKYGKVRRPWVGIYGVSLTKPLAKQLGLPIEKGVLIIGVVEGSPAYRAGLRKGDVIVEVNNEPVENLEEFISKLKERRIGEWVRLALIRGSSKRLVITTLEEAPEY